MSEVIVEGEFMMDQDDVELISDAETDSQEEYQNFFESDSDSDDDMDLAEPPKSTDIDGILEGLDYCVVRTEAGAQIASSLRGSVSRIINDYDDCRDKLHEARGNFRKLMRIVDKSNTQVCELVRVHRTEMEHKDNIISQVSIWKTSTFF